MLNLLRSDKGLNKENLTRIYIGGTPYYTDNYVIKSGNKCLIFTGQLNGLFGEEYKTLQIMLESSADVYHFVQKTESLNGEWAMVYFETDTGNMFAFTDPFGTIPVYFNREKEVSTNAVSISYFKTFDLIYKSEVLKWGYNTDNRTPWKDVKRVMPLKLTKISRTAFESIGWYTETPIYMTHKVFTRDSKYDSIRTALHNAIAIQLDDVVVSKGKDFTIGVLLSGGLDSSIISYELLTLNKTRYNNELKFKFYTLDEDPKDVECTKAFCEMYGIETTFISYDKSSVDYEKYLRVNQTPIDLGSMIPNQILFEQIPERLFFTGDGADCLLGGFRRIDEYDSQLSDFMEEHPFYYSPKGCNAGFHYGVTLKCAFNDFNLVQYCLGLPLEERTHKKCLKDAYRDVLPECILNRQKLPLKTEQIVKDKNQYRYNLAKIFYNMTW